MGTAKVLHNRPGQLHLPPKSSHDQGEIFSYSGVSWTFSGNPDVIRDVRGWPSIDPSLRDEVQIPTQVDLGTGDWGYKIPRNHDPIRWFKLLLLNDQDAKEDVRNSQYLGRARQQLERLPEYAGDGVVDLIAKFLKNMWDHALQDIEREMGNIDTLPLKVAVTVPAIWPVYAREKLKEAARRAGINARRRIGETKLILVEEPEAAALSTLYEQRDHPNINVGETFIVCDCGGGTVDIISYEVTSTDPFQVKEAVKGDGKLCGAFLVDSAFEDWMKIKSGLKFGKVEANEFRLFMNDEWEHTMKRTFSGRETQETFVIRPPARVFSMIKKFKGTTDRFPIHKDTVEVFFHKTFTGIRTLISEQISMIREKYGGGPKNILLVGGLGGSPYLYNQLNGLHRNVLQPVRAWSAVARGAVIAVLKGTSDAIPTLPSVVSRVARFSYGVELGCPVDAVNPPLDRSIDRCYTNPDGREMVHRMFWYLKQNEPVDNREPVEYEFYKYIRTPDNLRNVELYIMTSDAETPPVRRDHTGSVQHLCTINYDIHVPWTELPQMRDAMGNVHRRMNNLRLMMKFEGEPKWSLRVGNDTIEREVNVQYRG
ncbi:unnamed protein product [Sordaria macrospora k-hell]|uniref:WGS project CABT00000000 data, contig 2.25 n=1 Tax=Sordaria macrospora (strain ATCC MYA-333 / DSM 997 / K(L3346) / K-hell) TaxID=771870 RepID=F7W3Q6_SORMK|nr:uncharacterized protein SMAC_05288 [Sordaria macrospora k-hell]KAH7632015.1 hypothetical protein B0T09DRAFT_397583 [Sordaria sp. MPI-SDFR-AT-0083]CCC12214.1 unnamed protein product [Sordaria macrospora k-hell]